jgi:hypothetical protein
MEASISSDSPKPRRAAKSGGVVLDSKKIETLSQHGVIAEIQTITPDDAARWLQSNKINRRLRSTHVAFLAAQITAGQWMLNGQAVIVSEDENILDGQHRLQAVIKAGEPITTLVIYGISFEAFKTIDTGVVRTGADALTLWHENSGRSDTRAVASAVKWCRRIEQKFYGKISKLSNTDVLNYVNKHPSLWQHAETLSSFPSSARPMSIASGLALLEMFARKDEETAQTFIRALFTGEGLHAKDPEYVVRNLFLKDLQRTSHYPQDAKMRMAVKAWNLRRRGRDANSQGAVSITSTDPERMEIV